MREISLPLPLLNDDQGVEMELKISGLETPISFRIVAFPWNTAEKTTSEERIVMLKNSIETYDKDWELIQIYTPMPESKFIKVLYRRRMD
ncbi:MAG TPA: hypothetical protein DCQ31_02280 [Bacteroidales bacterium]|nr:hypothetical protein [Bacteroidales bacterium]